MINTIIFDMDGVIVDSEHIFLRAKKEVLNEAGYKKEDSYHFQFMGSTAEYIWGKMKTDLDLPLTVNEYINKMDNYRMEIIKKEGLKAIPYVIELIHSLVKAGFKLGVASSSSQVEIESNLKELAIKSYFSQTVSGEDVAHSKPSPDVFLKIAELLHTKPENCLVFEDTKNGSQAAKKAGMYCIGFANPEFPPQELFADEVIQDFKMIDVEGLKTKNNT